MCRAGVAGCWGMHVRKSAFPEMPTLVEASVLSRSRYECGGRVQLLQRELFEPKLSTLSSAKPRDRQNLRANVAKTGNAAVAHLRLCLSHSTERKMRQQSWSTSRSQPSAQLQLPTLNNLVVGERAEHTQHKSSKALNRSTPHPNPKPSSAPLPTARSFDPACARQQGEHRTLAAAALGI